ncbi:MAG: hypothetical protein HYV09_06010 [Deltaproteobacteria bacterium]|nr:hypothetical protein [Deltaproteobacteria bacterium]
MRFLLIAVLLATPSVASAGNFTVEAGAGVALGVQRSPEYHSSNTSYGFALPSLSLGAFVAPDLAVVGRVSSTALDDEGHGFGHQTFFGAGVQYWASDHFFVGGAIGAAATGRGVLLGLGRHQRNGFGLNARAGVRMAHFGRNAISSFLEWTPVWYAESDTYVASTVHALAAGVEWQFGR